MPSSWIRSRVLNKRVDILMAILVTTILIIGCPAISHASQYKVDFYSLKSAPGGINSLEALLVRWWNWWENHPSPYSTQLVCMLKTKCDNRQSICSLSG